MTIMIYVSSTWSISRQKFFIYDIHMIYDVNWFEKYFSLHKILNFIWRKYSYNFGLEYGRIHKLQKLDQCELQYIFSILKI